MSVTPVSSEQFLPRTIRGRVLSFTALGALGIGAIAFVVPSLMPVGSESSRARVSAAVYPATLTWSLPHAGADDWLMPAGAVTIGESIFVVDTGNNRILKLASDGGPATAVGNPDEHGPALRMPMAIATDGHRLFIANSLGGNIVILDSSGRLENVITLPADATGGAPRPIGLAVTSDGGLVVSDAEHHRVLRLDASGAPVWSAGTGSRGGGTKGFNVPAALAVDGAGNIYVVDTLNARIVKLSPAGRFVRQIGERGDTAGTLARPKGVAVSKTGHVFISDGLLAAIEVFDADGTYLGLIGRRDPADTASPSMLVAPAGLSIKDEVLLVTDRHAGIVTFELRDRR